MMNHQVVCLINLFTFSTQEFLVYSMHGDEGLARSQFEEPQMESGQIKTSPV